MQAKQKSFSVASSFGLALLALSSLYISSCGGPNIHKDLKQDSRILRREWVRPTLRDWKAGERGTAYSNPVSYKHTLIYGNQGEGLSAIYPKSSKLRWNLPIAGGVDSEIAVDGDNGYFAAGDGNFYSIDLRTGKVNWRYSIRLTQASRPTVADGKVYFTTTDDTVYCLDASSGDWVWHYKRRSTETATVHGASSPLIFGKLLYVGLSDGFLVRLAADTGKLLAEIKLTNSNKFTDVDASPVMDNGNLYVPSYDGALHVIREKDLSRQWKYESGGAKSVRIEKGVIYFPSSDGAVIALKQDSGKLLWKFELDGGAPTQLVLTDKFLILGSSYQYLYVLNKENGRGLYRYNVGNKSGFSGSPLYMPASERLAADRVYLISGAGHLYAFTVDGKARADKRWARLRNPYQFIQ